MPVPDDGEQEKKDIGVVYQMISKSIRDVNAVDYLIQEQGKPTVSSAPHHLEKVEKFFLESDNSRPMILACLFSSSVEV